MLRPDAVRFVGCAVEVHDYAVEGVPDSVLLVSPETGASDGISVWFRSLMCCPSAGCSVPWMACAACTVAFQ